VSQTKFRVEHDPGCKEPLNEHTGEEPCLKLVPEFPSQAQRPAANYKRGPQGNQVSDPRLDYLQRYGPVQDGPLGTPGITDSRDNRDPEEIYNEMIAARDGKP
jgi:hypothetical protein